MSELLGCAIWRTICRAWPTSPLPSPAPADRRRSTTHAAQRDPHLATVACGGISGRGSDLLRQHPSRPAASIVSISFDLSCATRRQGAPHCTAYDNRDDALRLDPYRGGESSLPPKVTNLFGQLLSALAGHRIRNSV